MWPARAMASRRHHAKSCLGSSRLETEKCPFANLPESRSGRGGQGLTADKMAGCRWLKPLMVGQFEFLEWTQMLTCVTADSLACERIKRHEKSFGRHEPESG